MLFRLQLVENYLATREYTIKTAQQSYSSHLNNCIAIHNMLATISQHANKNHRGQHHHNHTAMWLKTRHNQNPVTA